MKSIIFPFLIFLLLPSCQTGKENVQDTKKEKIIETTRQYFDTYAQRTDTALFYSFYNDSVIFQDPILQVDLNSLTGLKSFYAWGNKDFSKHPNYPKTLIVEDVFVDNNVAITNGYFTPFYYQGQLYGDKSRMNFSIQLHFDEQLKIIRHTDWIDYPPELLNGVVKSLLTEQDGAKL